MFGDAVSLVVTLKICVISKTLFYSDFEEHFRSQLSILSRPIDLSCRLSTTQIVDLCLSLAHTPWNSRMRDVYS